MSGKLVEPTPGRDSRLLRCRARSSVSSSRMSRVAARSVHRDPWRRRSPSRRSATSAPTSCLRVRAAQRLRSCGEGRPSHADRGGEGGQRDLGGGPTAIRLGSRGQARPARLRTPRHARDRSARGCGRRRSMTSTSSFLPAQQHTPRSSGSTLSPGCTKLSLAHTGADRGGAIMVVGGGRRQIQFKAEALGVDSHRGSAPAGLG